MRRVFYGAAIQGAKDRKERSPIHQFFIETIKKRQYDVCTEHTTGKTYEEANRKLEQAIGPIPKDESERKRVVRDKMIEAIESDIHAAIFEVSTPSLGTGIEIAHAYLRPRLALPVIPVLALYQKDYWPNNLSTMIRGISADKVPQFLLREYTDLNHAKNIIDEFLKTLE
jgi:hypothetical protein